MKGLRTSAILGMITGVISAFLLTYLSLKISISFSIIGISVAIVILILIIRSNLE